MGRALDGTEDADRSGDQTAHHKSGKHGVCRDDIPDITDQGGDGFTLGQDRRVGCFWLLLCVVLGFIFLVAGVRFVVCFAGGDAAVLPLDYPALSLLNGG